MGENPSRVRKFLFSHYFHSGLRQAVGTLLPPVVLIGLLGEPIIGMAAAFGALCVSILDQPGPARQRFVAMSGAALLGFMTALLTGVATNWLWLLFPVVVAQTFFFGLFSALGRRGGMVGFACLLLMTLTLHHTVPPALAAWHALATLAGGLWYLAYSGLINHLQQAQQEEQSLAVALFATANYVAAKAEFYDPGQDLETSYRRWIPYQATLTDKQQAARDLVLAALPQAQVRGDRRRLRLGSVFTDMIDLQETMLATYSDYAEIRRALADNDFLLFGRDALRKIAADLDEIGMALIGHRRSLRTTGIKAELRAMEYEVVLLRRDGFPEAEPEAWVVVVQILRRLRTASRLLARMQDATAIDATILPDLARGDQAWSRFFTRDSLSVKRLLTHLTLQSPHFRYAIRLSVAVAAALFIGTAMGLAASRYSSELGSHGYWIILTILVIMKPGFALSGQLNRRRLLGTLIGCALVLVLMQATQAPWILLGAMFIAAVLSNSLNPLHPMASSVFNTMLVLVGFHFLSPGSLAVIGERALDAVIGSFLVWSGRWLLPYWESRNVAPLAQRALAATRDYLSISRRPPDSADEAQASNPLSAASPTSGQDPGATPGPGQTRNDLPWRLARRDVHIAFANFAEALYRMQQEPASHRLNVPVLNDLLVQNHIMAAQISVISALLPALGNADRQPVALRELLDQIDANLVWATQRLQRLDAEIHDIQARTLAPAAGELPAPQLPQVEALLAVSKALESPGRTQHSPADDPINSAFEPAHLTYSLRQMIRASQRLRNDVMLLLGEDSPPPHSSAAPDLPPSAAQSTALGT